MKLKFIFPLLTLASGIHAPCVEAEVIEILPTGATTVQYCVPFGAEFSGDTLYGPDRGFIYKNLPAFELVPGSTLAFDLGHANDNPIEFDIGMTTTTVNGGGTPAAALTKVVSNTQHAADPDGDDIVGNYELVFTVEQAFSFPGGGLIINFSNPGVNFVLDGTCGNGHVVSTTSSDPSDYFAWGYFRDVLIVDSSVGTRNAPIGGFIIDTAPALATFSVGGNVSGLTGTGLELQNNGGDTLAVAADGPFTFLTELAGATTYEVTVSNQPTGQTCIVGNASGTIASADITDIAVTCEDDVVVPPPATPVPVPSLSEGALILLAMLLGLMAFTNRNRLF